MVVEIAQFKAKSDVSDTEVMAASQEAHEGFLMRHKGFVSRELLKSGNDEWIDILHWKTMEDAQKAMRNMMDHPSTKKFNEIIDPSSIKIMHLEVMKKY